MQGREKREVIHVLYTKEDKPDKNRITYPNCVDRNEPLAMGGIQLSNLCCVTQVPHKKFVLKMGHFGAELKGVVGWIT